MAVGSTLPVTEMSTRNISWGGEGIQYIGMIPLPPPCAGCLETWEPQRPGTLRACPGLSWGCYFTFGESNKTTGTLGISWDLTQGLPKCKANA